jgi:antitoxin ParD1/3/4
MGATSINITLPESLMLFVEEQVQSRGCSDASEYLRTLILEEQRREARADLEQKLLEGLESPASEMTDDDWAELRAEILARNPELRGEA